jgi:hypothetical protein
VARNHDPNSTLLATRITSVPARLRIRTSRARYHRDHTRSRKKEDA